MHLQESLQYVLESLARIEKELHELNEPWLEEEGEEEEDSEDDAQSSPW